MRNPVRLELTPRCTLAYAEAPRDDVYLTLRPGIERHNFGVTPAGTALGWVRGAALGELFVARNNARSCLLRDLLLLDHGALLTRQALKLFMITNNPDIARSDCLLYAVQADGSELVPVWGRRTAQTCEAAPRVVPQASSECPDAGCDPASRLRAAQTRS